MANAEDEALLLSVAQILKRQAGALCPRCTNRQVDPRSESGWCARCDGQLENARAAKRQYWRRMRGRNSLPAGITFPEVAGKMKLVKLGDSWWVLTPQEIRTRHGISIAGGWAYRYSRYANARRTLLELIANAA